MKWPWVSRRELDDKCRELGAVRARTDAEISELRATTVPTAALEAVTAERDWLRERYTALLDHLQRVDRAEHGMSELPRQPKAPLEPMPRELFEHFEGFQNKTLARAQRAEAYKRHAQGVAWSIIVADAFPPEDDDIYDEQGIETATA